MTEGTTQSAEDRAREAIRDWAELVDMDGEWLSAAIVSLFEEYQFTIIDTDELAQLRAEHEALAEHIENHPNWRLTYVEGN